MTRGGPTCGDAGGRRADGAPCRSDFGLGEDGRCRMHSTDPKIQAEVQEARSRGGKATVGLVRKAKALDPLDVPPPPETLEDAVRWSSWAVHAVATGELDSKRGREIGYLVNCFKAAVEKRDLEKEIEKLREELAEAQARPKLA